MLLLSLLFDADEDVFVFLLSVVIVGINRMIAESCVSRISYRKKALLRDDVDVLVFVVWVL